MTDHDEFDRLRDRIEQLEEVVDAELETATAEEDDPLPTNDSLWVALTDWCEDTRYVPMSKFVIEVNDEAYFDQPDDENAYYVPSEVDEIINADGEPYEWGWNFADAEVLTRAEMAGVVADD